jgi:hypothetical protein
MGPVALVLAWTLSLVPLALERSGFLDLSAVGADSTPRASLCALVWIAVAGMPRARLASADLRAWWGSTMACVPALTLAAALDQQSGGETLHVALTAAWSLLLVALSALAAELAQRHARSQVLHATLWLVAIVGAPLFAAALGWGARAADATAPAWTVRAASFSPLQWSLSSIDSGAQPFAALALAALLCAIAAVSSRGELS